MTWTFAPAWALAAALLLPLAAHLLSRFPPRRVPFPSLRFLQAVSAASRRMHALHDRPLWALRCLIVLAVVAAAAGPTVATSARRAAWTPEPHRAMVLIDDASWAGDGRIPPGLGRQYRDPILRHALAAAVADAPAVGPYEIVVQWDGQRSALDVPDLAGVPPDVGLTLVRDVAKRRQGNLTDRDVRVLEPGQADRAEWLERADPPDAMAWRLQERMRADSRLVDAAQRSRLDGRVAEERKQLSTFAPLARDADGTVLVWGATAAGRPLVVLDARPTDPVTIWAPVVAAGAMWALGGGLGPDAGVWTDDEMAKASRPSQRRGVVELPGGLDTRAAWSVVLLLLAAEAWARRRVARRDAAAFIHDDAA